MCLTLKDGRGGTKISPWQDSRKSLHFFQQLPLPQILADAPGKQSPIKFLVNFKNFKNLGGVKREGDEVGDAGGSAGLKELRWQSELLSFISHPSLVSLLFCQSALMIKTGQATSTKVCQLLVDLV